MSNKQSEQLQPINPALVTFDQARCRYEALQAVVKSLLIEGEDYGTLPGTEEAYLKKSGAEKLRARFSLRADPQLMAHHEDWEKGIFFYRFRSTLYTPDGSPVATAERSCTNQEDKFKFHWVKADPPESKAQEAEMKAAKTGRWKKVNDAAWEWQEKEEVSNPYDCVNNVLARAQKRANSAATVEAFAATGFFAKEGKKAKNKEAKKDADGSTRFWLHVKEHNIETTIAKPLADRANSKEITWEQAMANLPK